MKKLNIIGNAVIDEFARIEKAIKRSIENYLKITAKVYVSRSDGNYDNAAWVSMSRDNSYIKDYVSELDFTVYREDEDENGNAFYVEDTRTFQRLLNLERKLENLFDAREHLFNKYGMEEIWQASDKKKSA